MTHQENITASSAFESCKGTWLFERHISGHGLVKGTAVFEVNNNECDTLHYRENGKWINANATKCKISKAYLYTLKDENRIDIFFYDNNTKGDHFLTLAFQNSTNKIEAHHLCKSDIYKASYRFVNQDQFYVAYHVIGPKKDYEIKTAYQRSLTAHCLVARS